MFANICSIFYFKSIDTGMYVRYNATIKGTNVLNCYSERKVWGEQNEQNIRKRIQMSGRR